MSNYQNCSGNANCGNVQYEKVLWNEKSVLKSEYLRVACSHVDDVHRSFQHPPSNLVSYTHLHRKLRVLLTS